MGVSWKQLTDLALTLSEAGHIVCQIHSKGQAERWQWMDYGATPFSESDGDYVVTSDGVRHQPT